MRNVFNGPVALSLSVCFFTAVLQAHAQELFSFRGFTLGITTEDFKKLPYPDKTREKLHPICSSDAVARGKNGISLLYVDASDAKAGIERCSFFEFSAALKSYWERAVTIEGYGEAVFRFVKRPGDSARLFSITVAFPQSKFSSIAPAYMEKFGAPPLDTTNTVQNAFGASFPLRILEWKNAENSITLIERAGKVDQSAVTYLHNKLYEQAEAQKSAVTGPIRDRL